MTFRACGQGMELQGGPTCHLKTASALFILKELLLFTADREDENDIGNIGNSARQVCLARVFNAEHARIQPMEQRKPDLPEYHGFCGYV